MTGLQRSILFGLQILVLLIALDGGVANAAATKTKRVTTTTTKKPTTTKPPTTTTPKKTTTTKPPTTTTTKTTTGKTTTTKPTIPGQTTTIEPTIPGQTTTTEPTIPGQTTTTKPTIPGQTTTTKPTTTIPTTQTPKILQCTSVDFMSLQNKCCSPPANNLLASSYNKTIETTCQNFGVDNSVFNVFVLNKLQNILKNNTVNRTDLFNLAAQLGQSACYIECYLNQSGAIDSNGTINVDALTALLIANQDPNGPWDKIIKRVVGECSNAMTQLSLTAIIPPSLIGCNVTGGLITQCVLASIVDQCPSRVTSAACDIDYAQYKECTQLLTIS